MQTNRGDGNGLPWRFRDLVVSVGLILIMIGLYAWADAQDRKADVELERLAKAERERIATQERLPAKVRESYAADLAEAERCFTSRGGRTVCYRGDPR